MLFRGQDTRPFAPAKSDLSDYSAFIDELFDKEKFLEYSGLDRVDNCLSRPRRPTFAPFAKRNVFRYIQCRRIALAAWRNGVHPVDGLCVQPACCSIFCSLRLPSIAGCQHYLATSQCGGIARGDVRAFKDEPFFRRWTPPGRRRVPSPSATCPRQYRYQPSESTGRRTYHVRNRGSLCRALELGGLLHCPCNFF